MLQPWLTLQHHNRKSHVTRVCLPRCRRSHWCCLHANAWACPCCRWSSERWASASERTFVRQLSSRLKISWKRLPLNMRNSLQALQILSPKNKTRIVRWGHWILLHLDYFETNLSEGSPVHVCAPDVEVFPVNDPQLRVKYTATVEPTRKVEISHGSS